MEFKWLAIMMIFIMLGAFTGMAFEQHDRNNCRVAAINAGKTSAEIEKICK